MLRRPTSPSTRRGPDRLQSSRAGRGPLALSRQVRSRPGAEERILRRGGDRDRRAASPGPSYDHSQPAGFPNGRRLEDDVVDGGIALLTRGQVTSDLVAPHDDYLADFPHLGRAELTGPVTDGRTGPGLADRRPEGGRDLLPSAPRTPRARTTRENQDDRFSSATECGCGGDASDGSGAEYARSPEAP